MTFINCSTLTGIAFPVIFHSGEMSLSFSQIGEQLPGGFVYLISNFAKNRLSIFINLFLLGKFISFLISSQMSSIFREFKGSVEFLVLQFLVFPVNNFFNVLGS